MWVLFGPFTRRFADNKLSSSLNAESLLSPSRRGIKR